MVYAVRERCGRQLALEAGVEADIVSTVPDSATPAALGYAQQVTFGCVLWPHFKFYLSFVLILTKPPGIQASIFGAWEGCARKGIQHKNGGVGRDRGTN